VKSTNFKPFFIITLLFVASVASAQSGAIYDFDFRVDPVLIDYKKTEFKGIAFSKRDEMPEHLLDSIKIKTEKAFANKLQMPVKMCFHIFKSEILNLLNEGYIGRLPLNSFRRAKADCPNYSRYISLDVEILSSESSSSFFPFTKTKSKPYIAIYVKVYDEYKNKVWKKNITIEDFEKLRSSTMDYGIVNITKSEILSPLDIYEMYLMGLDMLMKE